MRTQKSQTKSQNKLYFCPYCAYVTDNSEELDRHIKLSHEDFDDEVYELEFITSKQNKPKTLKEKAIQQLKLLVFGKDVHHEYYGWCEIPYFITTEKCSNVIKIKLEPGMWIC